MQGINPEILKEICEVKMPFGKHAGIVLADLPISYLEWFHRQGMPKGKLGKTFQKLPREHSFSFKLYFGCLRDAGKGAVCSQYIKLIARLKLMSTTLLHKVETNR